MTFFGYLRSLPALSLRALYANRSSGMYACRAVLQHLPEPARQFVLRLAVSGGSFPQKKIDLWTKEDTKMALVWMEHLCVIEPWKRKIEEEEDLLKGGDDSKSQSGDDEDVKLTKEFHEGIQKLLTSLSSAPWPCVKAEAAKSEAEGGEKSSKHIHPSPPTLVALERYTQRRWDSVLHFLVGSTSEGGEEVEYPPAAVVRFLEETGLMQEDPDWKKSGGGKGKAPLVITNRGYEFMLLDTHVQVWQFVLQYLKSKAEEIQSEALLFFIGLSYCRVGEAYPAHALSKGAQTLMKTFSNFGLLYLTKVGEMTLFYPTRVAVNLVAATNTDEGGLAPTGPACGIGSILDAKDNDGREEMNPPSSASASRSLEAALSEPLPSTSHIAIIVQTNFQLCAYTTSQLHVSMLGLFCDVAVFQRLPNIVFYHITRDSVKGAFELGITAKQILRFLKMHAHPRLRATDQPLVPSNVEDQIWLWGKERRRVQFEEVYIYQCREEAEYQAVQQYAQDRGALSWSDENRLRIFIKCSGAEVIVSFARRWILRAAQRRSRESEGRIRQLNYSYS